LHAIHHISERSFFVAVRAGMPWALQSFRENGWFSAIWRKTPELTQLREAQRRDQSVGI
jgi:hypothetical protein